MAILLNDNLDVAANKPTDTRYGPYATVQAANDAIPAFKRYIGLTVGIGTTSVVDYWYKSGTTNTDLVEKTSGASGGVTSVNGETGAVTLGAADVGAQPLQSIASITVYDFQQLTAARNQRVLVYADPSLAGVSGAVVYLPTTGNVNGDRLEVVCVGLNGETLSVCTVEGGELSPGGPGISGPECLSMLLGEQRTFIFNGSWWIVGTVEAHTHDNRYYTETETDALLASKQDTLSRTSITSSVSQTVVLPQSRNREITIRNYNGTLTLVLPRMENANSEHDSAKDGDRYVFRAATLAAGTTTVVTEYTWTGSSYTGTTSEFPSLTAGTWTFVLRSGIWELESVQPHTHSIGEVDGLQAQLDVRPTFTFEESVTIPEATNEFLLDDITPPESDSPTRFFALRLEGSSSTAQLTIVVGTNSAYTKYGKTTLNRVISASASGGTRRPYRLVSRNFVNSTVFTDQELVAYPAAEFPSSRTDTVTLPYNTGTWLLGSLESHTHLLDSLDSTGSGFGDILVSLGDGSAEWANGATWSGAHVSPSDIGAAPAFHTHDASDIISGFPVEYVIACSDETTALTGGTAKVTFRAPITFQLISVSASVNVAPTGSPLIVDINNGPNSVLSTELSIDINEKTSATAATPAVINTSFSSFAADAEITIDLVQPGSLTAGAGLKVILRGTRL